jgi:5-methylcytosine-specific restriction endonuclease McrA
VSLRLEVFDRDGGECVSCGTPLARGGDLWAWHVHHVVKEQTLKARGCRPRWWRSAALAVLVCRRCHERHTNRMGVIPLERLPSRVLRSAAILGPWAVDLLRRNHPPADAGRNPVDAWEVSG